MLYQHLANRKPEACPLSKAVQLDKTSENSILLIPGYPTTGIPDVKIQLPTLPQLIAEADTSLFCKLNGIGHQIDDQLGQAVSFQMDITFL